MATEPAYIESKDAHGATHVWARSNGADTSAVSDLPNVSVEATKLRESNSRTVTIAVIDDRALMRQCFSKSIEETCKEFSVISFSTVKDWLNVSERYPEVGLILLFYYSHQPHASIDALSELSNRQTPVILVADEENIETVHSAIGLGARGFIPPSIDLGVAVMAMQLVRAGGIYLPESLLRGELRAREETHDKKVKSPIDNLFTERQAAVVEALCQGKPNKIIAYELNMRESTVKVHIRNVMKKLKAKNRTEIAFLTNRLLNGTGCRSASSEAGCL